MRNLSIVVAGFVAAGVGAALTVGPLAWAADSRLMSYGKHLSGECSSCHRIDGIDNGIPSITGWPVADFVATLQFYREGARVNPAIVSVARSLDEEQLLALAVYYGSLPRPAKKSAVTP